MIPATRGPRSPSPEKSATAMGMGWNWPPGPTRKLSCAWAEGARAARGRSTARATTRREKKRVIMRSCLKRYGFARSGEIELDVQNLPVRVEGDELGGNAVGSAAPNRAQGRVGHRPLGAGCAGSYHARLGRQRGILIAGPGEDRAGGGARRAPARPR